MMDIKQTAEGSLIISSSVSDFCDSMGYCEYKIKHFLKGIRPPQTQITLDGANSHEREETYEREHFKLKPVTSEELMDFAKDIEFAREGLFTRFQRELLFGDRRLLVLIYGRADKVMRSHGTLIVEDSKFPVTSDKYRDQFEPFDDQRLQTLLYLNSSFSETGSLDEGDCFEIICQKRAWIINIKDKATMQTVKTFQGYQTREAENFLSGRVSQFAQIALGLAEPTHHHNLRKCQSCRFKDCEFQLH